MKAGRDRRKKPLTGKHYLTTISRHMGLHPKSLHQLKAKRLERGASWPKPTQTLPDGKELYDAQRFQNWYDRNVGDHWGARGRTA